MIPENMLNPSVEKALIKAEDEALLGIPPPKGFFAGGPRRPRVHNSRFLGSRAYALVPAKTARQLRNRAQRQARKANR